MADLFTDAEERTALVHDAAGQLGLASWVVEKDLWVCWLLARVNQIEGLPKLTFKGGTSLSKVYRLIERFSEDIDLTFSREGWGFEDSRDPLSAEISENERKRLLQAIADRAAATVRDQVVPGLHAACRSLDSGWSVIVDPVDDQAVLFWVLKGPNHLLRVVEAAHECQPTIGCSVVVNALSAKQGTSGSGDGSSAWCTQPQAGRASNTEDLRHPPRLSPGAAEIFVTPPTRRPSHQTREKSRNALPHGRGTLSQKRHLQGPCAWSHPSALLTPPAAPPRQPPISPTRRASCPWPATALPCPGAMASAASWPVEGFPQAARGGGPRTGAS